MRKLFTKFVRFCLVGLSSTLIDIAILYVLVEFVHLPVLLAAAIGLVCASINGFILNKTLTFKNTSKNIYRQYLGYLFVSIGGLILTLLFMHGFTTYLQMHYLVAKVITVVVVTFWNFTMNNYLTFRTPIQR